MKIIIKTIEKITAGLGWLTGWLTFIMVIMMMLVVILRYGFDIGLIALQEGVLYLHGMIFLLGCGYALKHEEHVRVDVFYRNFSNKNKHLVDLFGAMFLALPVAIFIFCMSWTYVLSSWQIFESSPEPGGLPLVYIQKSLLLAFCVTFTLQILAQAAKSICYLIKPEVHEHPIEGAC